MRPLLLTLALLCACDPDSAGSAPDAATPPAADAASLEPADAAGMPDAQQAGPSDAGPDASLPLDAGATDGGPTGYGPVQCRVQSDCPGISSCNRSPPGGICTGCGGTTDCPGALDCYAGACVRTCARDAECNPGMRCSTAGRCVMRPCPCPAPYVCNTGTSFCERPACPAGSCPSPFTCVSGVCVEP